MKIKSYGAKAISLYTSSTIDQYIHFDTEQERDVVFNHWSKAIAELNKSKAIYRPVYGGKDGEIRILSLRYTTQDEILEVEKKRFEHFGDTMKLIGVYNELERTFEQVNF